MLLLLQGAPFVSWSHYKLKQLHALHRFTQWFNLQTMFLEHVSLLRLRMITENQNGQGLSSFPNPRANFLFKNKING